MAAQEQAGTAWLDATPFGHSAHFVGCALRSAGRFTSLTGASRLVTYGAKPRPPQKSGYVHASLTTCLNIRFTPVQIGWTPPGFYGGLGSPSLTRGLRPHQLTVLGHLNGWGRFTQAAPPNKKATTARAVMAFFKSAWQGVATPRRQSRQSPRFALHALARIS